MKKFFLVLAVLLAGYSSVQADVLPFLGGGGGANRAFHSLPARPSPPNLRIEASNQGVKTRLLIPRKLLATLSTAELAPGVNEPRFAAVSLPNLAMGLSLSATLACGGFCLLKKPRLAIRIGLGLVVLALVIPGVGTALAHQPPPPLPPFTLSGNVIVEIVEEGDTIRLILNKNTPLEYRW